MDLLLLLLLVRITFITGLHEYNETNVTKPFSKPDVKKDMYVIHAMVYQVGIITNKTNNETDTNLGKQEAVTFFHSNGSKIDFSKIPQPILTNVTAESLVGIIPSPAAVLKKSPYQHGPQEIHEDANYNKKLLHKRSTAFRGNGTISVVNGSAVIPKEASVHSIALPPLLALNNNLSSIPVPIPNTSIVHYDKINTLFHIPAV